jgi:hypothetical protein
MNGDTNHIAVRQRFGSVVYIVFPALYPLVLYSIDLPQLDSYVEAFMHTSGMHI